MGRRARADEFTAYAGQAQQRLFRQAVLLTGDAGSARDLVQATLVKMYVAWSRIDTPRGLRPADDGPDVPRRPAQGAPRGGAAPADRPGPGRAGPLTAPGNAGPFAEDERILIPDHDPDDIPDDWSFGTELHVMNEDVSARLGFSELGWDELSGNELPGITDAEMLAVAQHPTFLELVRVGVQWWYDQPPPEPLEINGELVRPLTGKGQQVPPKFPS